MEQLQQQQQQPPQGAAAGAAYGSTCAGIGASTEGHIEVAAVADAHHQGGVTCAPDPCVGGVWHAVGLGQLQVTFRRWGGWQGKRGKAQRGVGQTEPGWQQEQGLERQQQQQQQQQHQGQQQQPRQKELQQQQQQQQQSLEGQPGTQEPCEEVGLCL